MSNINEKKLEELAVQELLFEAKRGKERAATMGPSGWQKKAPIANKRFLQQTLASALHSHRTVLSKRHKISSDNHNQSIDLGCLDKKENSGEPHAKKMKSKASTSQEDRPAFQWKSKDGQKPKKRKRPAELQKQRHHDDS